MDRLIYWIRKELILHLDFNYYQPRVRVGWVWVIIAFCFFHYFSYIFWGIITIIAIYNFINR